MSGRHMGGGRKMKRHEFLARQAAKKVKRTAAHRAKFKHKGGGR